ncbi:MAG: TraR/DksA family transcriptional regulator [Candidatus Krumholzibacteria bacterium]|nr:TraR/DksA family transcriptional regulator [Candidatus Krumholzibacteria bacterium]MDH4337199.1 TraR/DksA family transcriptional regulator [Candidatus Krumholzibacteria bacterium]MDH5268662.1 TraR/DksA family transcriptional regulator [Candidatus Krumholzibacteria bacterium]
MNKRELQRFRTLVEAERQRVLQRLGMIEEEIQGMAASQSGNQSYSNHMADIGSDVIEQEQAFLHASQGTDYVIALEAALRRIDKGTYGVCEECSEKIPPRRLEAFLAARLCIKCQSRAEKMQRS